jgi:hypothetical protein
MKKLRIILPMIMALLFSHMGFSQSCAFPTTPDNCIDCIKINCIHDTDTLCSGGIYTVAPCLSPNATSWSWFGPGLISPGTSGTIPPPVPIFTIIPPALPGWYSYTFTASGLGPNIISNSDFSAGNTDFCTDYYYVPPGGNIDPPTYSIVSNSNLQMFSAGPCTYPSVSPHSGTDMLMACGDGNVDVVWRQQMPICPCATYTFSMWVHDLSFFCPGFGTLPAGVPIFATISCAGSSTTMSIVPSTTGWLQLTFNWTAPCIGQTADIKIHANGIGALPWGTAFALDDITMRRNCSNSKTVSLYTTPLMVGGPLQVCTGSTITLTSTVPGTWGTSTPIASIDPATGIVTGINAGVVTFTYTANGGCIATHTVSVNATPKIVGMYSVCQGSTVTISSPPPPGPGLWSVGIGTGIIGPGIGANPWDLPVTGISPGTVPITYTIPGTGCYATVEMTVEPLPGPPTVPPFAICVGSSYYPVSSLPILGGTWSSSPAGIVGVVVGANPTTVTGIAPGTATITYTTPAGCTSTGIVTVQACPGGGGGSITLCLNQCITLLAPVPGGVWSSASWMTASVSPMGVVCGGAFGTTTIMYTVTIGGTTYVYTWIVTVVPPPTACVQTITVGTFYAFEFTGTPGATVTYCVYDYSGTYLGSLTVVLGAGPTVVLYPTVSAVYPSAFRICICDIELNGCHGVCTCGAGIPGCCASVNPPGPRFGNSSNSSHGTTADPTHDELPMMVIPNPNNGTFTVAGAVAGNASEVRIEVVDMVGKVVLSTTGDVHDGTIHTHLALPQHLPSGVYMVKIMGGSTSRTVRFTINK